MIPRGRISTRFLGYTVGRWEGDTLVLDSKGFTDETWLARGGWFHSDEMRVVEKFTRVGNQMTYDVTVEDPVVLLKPWVMPTVTMRNTGANTIVGERGACTDHEQKEASWQIGTERSRIRICGYELPGIAPSRPFRQFVRPSVSSVRLPCSNGLKRPRSRLWLRESPSIWALPTILTLHTTGMAVLVGASWVLDLRLLGVSRNVPLSAYRWVFPVAGGRPGRQHRHRHSAVHQERRPRGERRSRFSSRWLLVIASVATLRADAFACVEQRRRSIEARGSVRLLAIASILAWTGAVTAGRLLAYLVVDCCESRPSASRA